MSSTKDAESAQHVLSELLRAARMRAGLSQNDLAERCGVTQPAVAGWETGKRPMLETTLEQVALALNMTVEELLWRELGRRRKAARLRKAHGRPKKERRAPAAT